ncbi:hypothetical protein EDD36DRAFT_443376 [Exophiala viscosa]|uniref:Uncharacterized protein n=1 Tax=Exophiala viscosa TaxID=2486360 RepID=A0AAN6ID39_9EURO|nr:hypothetical protein EDD36DRAFT_443376 [Exophiala viscosa]
MLILMGLLISDQCSSLGVDSTANRSYMVLVMGPSGPKAHYYVSYSSKASVSLSSSMIKPYTMSTANRSGHEWSRTLLLPWERFPGWMRSMKFLRVRIERSMSPFRLKNAKVRKEKSKVDWSCEYVYDLELDG